MSAHCISGCPPAITADGTTDGIVTSPPELKLLKWDCDSECKYRCMIDVQQGAPPVKYYGKWPFTRVLGFQEFASSSFSMLNLLANLFGLLTFLRLVDFKLPRKPVGDKGPHYEYAGLFAIYGVFAVNAWFWSAAFHARDVKYTEGWDYSSAIALLGLSLLVCLIRTNSLRVEATRVMVGAPIIAFCTTHILYMNLYTFDYGWNLLVCTTMGVATLLLWTAWALWSNHPASWKVLVVAAGTALSLLLELFDFPPVAGLVDAHALWHAATVPLTLLWWSFLRSDAKSRTQALVAAGKKTRKVESKKSQ